MDEKQVMKDAQEYKTAVEQKHVNLRIDAQTLYGENRVKYDPKTGTLKAVKR